MSVRVRFAPSPTGSPHVGNLRTAIFNWLFARANGGTFIARLEDTDRTPDRYKPESTWELEEAMRWLGIVPDEWWVGGGPYAPYVQSERLASYRDVADALLEKGAAYRCFCTRERLAAAREQGQGGYDRVCRDIHPDKAWVLAEAGEPHVVRLKMPLDGLVEVVDEVRGTISYAANSLDDQVLLKQDGFPTYFLACAVDDIAMHISHIIRGDDWLSSAAKLVLIWDAMGMSAEARPKFVHLPLIVGDDKAKLAKRHGATMFGDFMREGYLPEAMFNYLSLLGWSTGAENKELMSVGEIVERFSLDHIQTSPAMFDYEKLKSFNAHYIRQSPLGRVIGLARPHVPHASRLGPFPEELVNGAIALEHTKARTMADFGDLVKPLLYWPTYNRQDAEKRFRPRPVNLVSDIVDILDQLDPFSAEIIEQALRAYAIEKGMKFAHVVHPMRVAILGQMDGPSLMHSMELIGLEQCRLRLVNADKEPLFAPLCDEKEDR